VLLEGPIIDGQPTVMLTADLPCLTAADAYWRAVLDTSFACSQAPERIPGLSDRQCQVLALLTAELSDEQVAASLGVSVRTVRGEIARAMAELGVRSRFSLGRAVEDVLRVGRTPGEDR
jgi:DNA-binding NarL/FixJ family response regulator